VAARIGRTVGAVRCKRGVLGIPRAPAAGGGREPWWTAQELALLGTAPDADVAERTGRTVGAVRQKRRERGIPRAAQGGGQA
jgi:hypothetical protein